MWKWFSRGLKEGQHITLAVGEELPVEDSRAHIFQAIDAEGWMATKMKTRSGSVYLIKPQRDDSITEPYIVPSFIVGSPGHRGLIKGSIYNVPTLEQGAWRTTSDVMFIKLEKGRKSAIVDPIEVSREAQRSNQFKGVVIKNTCGL